MREAPEYAKRALREVPEQDKLKSLSLPRNVACEAYKHDAKQILAELQRSYGIDDYDVLCVLRGILLEQEQGFLEIGAAQVMAGKAAVGEADKKAERGSEEKSDGESVKKDGDKAAE